MFENNEWRYEKPIKKTDITRFERTYSIQFPMIYIEFCLDHNGSRPVKNLCYSIKNTKKNERVIKSFLSFNEKDKENIWNYTFNHLSNGHTEIPFAVDNFGNSFCFDNDFKIIFYNHETDNYENVADKFEDFIESLYS